MASVSVIIPTYNRAHLLPMSVHSAFSAGTDVEVIVVDNGSSDTTAKVCKSLQGIKYIRLAHNQGPATARNVGFAASASEFVTFLDDDDIRLPGSLDIQLQSLNLYAEAGVVYGQCIQGDNNCNPSNIIVPRECKDGDLFFGLIEWMCIAWQTMIFRKSCLQQVGLFNPQLVGAEDWDLIIRVTESFPAVAVQQPVMVYRMPLATSDQLSSNWAKSSAICSQVQLASLQLPRAQALSPKQRRDIRRKFLNRLSDSLVWRADEACKGGHGKDALLQLIYAFKYRPLRTMRPMVLKIFLQSLMTEI